jgi:hypothetical protein
LIADLRQAGRLDDMQVLTLSNNGLLVREEASIIFPELEGFEDFLRSLGVAPAV